MTKGCKLSINIASDDVTSLGKGSKIKFEWKGYNKSDVGAKDTLKYTMITEEGR
jgi:hypothetical protein